MEPDVVKIGLISDIHADSASLHCAIQLLESANVETVLCAGDLVERGKDGNAVIEFLRERLIPCVEGNHDENAIRHAELSANVAGSADDASTLSVESLTFIEGLPVTQTFTFGNTTLLLAHATPSNNGATVFQDSSHSKLEKRFKKDLSRMDADILVIGHTHFPFDLTFRDKRILNPGCACNLQSRDSHTCGILDLEDESFTVFDLSTREPCEIEVLTF